MHDEPRWRRYLRFWRRDVAHDVDDELAFHFEQRVAEFMNAGATRTQAEAEARARFGDVRNTHDELLSIGQRVERRRERLQSLDNLRHDVVFAVRSLRRSPGLAIACIVTIALGVGANGAMFSLTDRLFTRPPSGVQDPAALRRMYVRTSPRGTTGPSTIRSTFAYPMFTLLDSVLAPRVRLAGYTPPDTMPMSADATSSPTLTVHGAYVTRGYMPLLGARPALGRFFAGDEEIMGSPAHVAVISERFWRRAFDADSKVIGKVVSINRQRATIIGVAAHGFDGPDLGATDVWMPFSSYPASANDATWYESYFSGTQLRLIGRVAPGTTNEWISNVATTIAHRTSAQGMRGFVTNVLRDTGAVILTGPILEALGPSIGPVPEVGIATRLVGITIIVLLIACANVASLLLARAFGRRREIAVRLALGVSRRRLVAQLLCEGVLLATIAGGAALLVSVWAGNALRALIMPATYFADSAVDIRVVVFIGIIAVTTGILAGIVPAVQASHPGLTDALKSGTRDGGASGGTSRLRQLLLVAQVSMSVLLLYGAGLYVHSLLRLRSIDLGFDAESVIYGEACLLDRTGSFIDVESCWSPRIAQSLAEVARRLEGAPGIQSVALSTAGPMKAFGTTEAYMPDGTSVPLADERNPMWTATTPSYLDATGSRLARGRFFTTADRTGPPVMVVNELAARTYWPQRDALGQCLRLKAPTAPCSTVIGVIHDSHVAAVVERPLPQIITPFASDAPGGSRGANKLIVRANAGQTVPALALVRREFAAVFPPSAVPFIKSVEEMTSTQMRPWRVGLLLFGGFGVLALIVAALGTYSVLSYAVTQRLHEIGVRIALGARTSDVLRLVVSEGLRLAMIGVAIGLAVALAASRVMQSLLYDTSPREPLVTLGVAALLVAIAAAASAVPARRAARVDPVEVLRAE